MDAFLKGDTGLDAPPRDSPVAWLGASGWKDLLALCDMNDAFEQLRKDFEKNKDTWKQWYDLEAPETVELPDGHQEKLTSLQRLCVMRCFRPDRVYNAVKTYVLQAVGEKYVQPPVLDYGRILAQSTERSPMVFILSPGADPQGDIQLLCDEKGMMSKFRFIALGQGQGPKAEHLIDQGTKSGHWVLLQNCHLLVSWQKMLEKKLELMKAPYVCGVPCCTPSTHDTCTRQFFTKSCLGDDAAVLAPSSGKEPASPRHRAGVASMALRTTR